jgi:hypothetical protein
MTGEATVRSDRPTADLPPVEPVRSVRSVVAPGPAAGSEDRGPR